MRESTCLGFIPIRPGVFMIGLLQVKQIFYAFIKYVYTKLRFGLVNSINKFLRIFVFICVNLALFMHIN